MRIAFRTDASAQIGTGHVARCLSLANGLRERGAQCTFICRHVPDAHAAQMEADGIKLLRTPVSPQDPQHGVLGVSAAQDAKEVAALLHGEHFDWLVVDHYALDAQWERRLRPIADRVLAIDDLADRPHDCDALLDQNLYHDMHRRYESRIAAGTRLLIGPKYALLRPDFASARNGVSVRGGPIRRILVFFGGIDAGGYTNSAIDALAQAELGDIAVEVVVGALHPRLSDLRRQCAEQGYALHVQTNRMADLMSQADLAIGAGGTATWERCSVGLPAIVFVVAENQRQLVRDAALAGIIYAPDVSPTDADALGIHMRAIIGNPQLRGAISTRAMQMVDGNGVQRVMQAMDVTGVTVRLAGTADIANMFEWRNHPEVRANSRSQGQFEWPTHLAWAQSVLADESKILLIGERAGRAVGVVRFDLAATEAEVSIYVTPGSGGQGLGSDLLHAAESWLARQAPRITVLHAEVLGDNERSHGLFRRTGYTRESSRYLKRLQR